MNSTFLQQIDSSQEFSIPQSIIKNQEKIYSLAYLLPYDSEKKLHSRLSDALKEYKMILIAAKEALTHYKDGNLSHFDSLVGENSCQIRATLIALLASKHEIQCIDLLNEIRHILNEIEIIEMNITDDKNGTPLGVYLKTWHLDVKIDCRELFLISSYILTKVRVLLPPNPSKRIVRNESTDTKKIKEISNVGSSFARDLVKKLRSVVSTISVNFVQEIAETISVPESVVDMISDKYCVSHDKFGRLKCLPCFWYTLVLLLYSLEIGSPLIFKVKNIITDDDYKESEEHVFYFKVVDRKYKEVERDELSDDVPALVVLGSCCRKKNEFPDLDAWRNELLSYNPVDLILAYAASHRQYPDESNDMLVSHSNCESFKYYRSKAYEWGCSLNDPSLFFLVHAYCDKLKNINHC